MDTIFITDLALERLTQRFPGCLARTAAEAEAVFRAGYVTSRPVPIRIQSMAILQLTLPPTHVAYAILDRHQPGQPVVVSVLTESQFLGSLHAWSRDLLRQDAHSKPYWSCGSRTAADQLRWARRQQPGVPDMETRQEFQYLKKKTRTRRSWSRDRVS